jgi:hypothetical protein
MLANTSAAMAREHQDVAREYLYTVAARTAVSRQGELDAAQRN